MGPFSEDDVQLKLPFCCIRLLDIRLYHGTTAPSCIMHHYLGQSIVGCILPRALAQFHCASFAGDNIHSVIISSAFSDCASYMHLHIHLHRAAEMHHFSKWYLPKAVDCCLQDWREFAKLAYPAALMDSCESFCWGLLGLLAGVLPEGAAAVSAVAVAMAIYGLTFMPILGCMITAAIRYTLLGFLQAFVIHEDACAHTGAIRGIHRAWLLMHLTSCNAAIYLPHTLFTPGT